MQGRERSSVIGGGARSWDCKCDRGRQRQEPESVSECVWTQERVCGAFETCL